MPSMTFRFTTECELTLDGHSYEEIYLQFKDFMHGKSETKAQANVSMSPPESGQIFFALDSDPRMMEIPRFKGDFTVDIAQHCPGKSLKPDPYTPVRLSQKVADRIPDVYW